MYTVKETPALIVREGSGGDHQRRQKCNCNKPPLGRAWQQRVDQGRAARAGQGKYENYRRRRVANAAREITRGVGHCLSERLCAVHVERVGDRHVIVRDEPHTMRREQQCTDSVS